MIAFFLLFLFFPLNNISTSVAEEFLVIIDDVKAKVVTDQSQETHERDKPIKISLRSCVSPLVYFSLVWQKMAQDFKPIIELGNRVSSRNTHPPVGMQIVGRNEKSFNE